MTTTPPPRSTRSLYQQAIARQRRETIARIREQLAARHRREEWNPILDAQDHEMILALGGGTR